MNANEALDEAFKAVELAQNNAKMCRIAINQRDILMAAMKEISRIDYTSLTVTDWECLRDAIVLANVAIKRAEAALK